MKFIKVITIGERFKFPIELLPKIEEFINKEFNSYYFPFTFDLDEDTVYICGKERTGMIEEFKGNKRYIEAIMLNEVIELVCREIKKMKRDEIKGRFSTTASFFVLLNDGHDGAYIIQQTHPIMVSEYTHKLTDVQFLREVVEKA